MRHTAVHTLQQYGVTFSRVTVKITCTVETKVRNLFLTFVSKAHWTLTVTQGKDHSTQLERNAPDNLGHDYTQPMWLP